MESICISLFAAASVIADGCATIVNDSTQRVEIVSDPPGATTKVGGIPIGTTPTSIDLKRGEPHSVTIEKDGYATAKQSIAQGTSGWIAVNILIGGLTGLIVDYSTGAAHTLKPDSVSPVLIASAHLQMGPVPIAQGAIPDFGCCSLTVSNASVVYSPLTMRGEP
jgi:hypothetical protein